PTANPAATRRCPAICRSASGALVGSALESFTRMNQRQPPASTSIPFDLAVFRRLADSGCTETSPNFAPGSSLDLHFGRAEALTLAPKPFLNRRMRYLAVVRNARGNLPDHQSLAG